MKKNPQTLQKIHNSKSNIIKIMRIQILSPRIHIRIPRVQICTPCMPLRVRKKVSCLEEQTLFDFKNCVPSHTIPTTKVLTTSHNKDNKKKRSSSATSKSITADHSKSSQAVQSTPRAQHHKQTNQPRPYEKQTLTVLESSLELLLQVSLRLANVFLSARKYIEELEYHTYVYIRIHKL